jgi:predicted nucleic acid-binding protein
VSVVLDSSATLARAFPDEQTGSILEVFEFIAQFGAVVPQLWRIEVANSLNVGIRRRRVTMEDRAGILADLEDLPIVVDSETSNQSWGDTLALADKHHLTVYDATYLELALRLSLPLATLDDGLRSAALREGVTLLGK